MTCPHGHTFHVHDGVLVLLSDSYAPRLRDYEAKLRAVRAAEGKRLLNQAIYRELPFGPADDEWRMRRYDLAVITRLLRPRGERLTVLEVGAWNGWLSHRLAGRGHHVTAVDYFSDEYDGLRAMKLYPLTWQAIQMDLDDLALLNQPYDVVILNRCVQFQTDPAAYVAKAKERVVPGGMLILTGLQIFHQPEAKIRLVAAWQTKLLERGLEPLKPLKGYLDEQDKARLEAQRVILRPYPQLRMYVANLKAVLNPVLPRHYYGMM